MRGLSSNQLAFLCSLATKDGQYKGCGKDFRMKLGGRLLACLCVALSSLSSAVGMGRQTQGYIFC